MWCESASVSVGAVGCGREVEDLGYAKIGLRKRLEMMMLAVDESSSSAVQDSGVTHARLPTAPPQGDVASAPEHRKAEAPPNVARSAASLDEGSVPVEQRRAWLAHERRPLEGYVAEGLSLLESICLGEDLADQRARSRHAAAMVRRGTLRRRSQYVVRIPTDSQAAPSSTIDIGCVEVLLVRKPPKQCAPEACCRFCLGDEDEPGFDEEHATEAAKRAAATEKALAVGQRGRLRRDVCACRGSASCVHEGCLLEYLAATGWGDQRCPTCKQRFVGAPALMLARVAARVRNHSAEEAGRRAAEEQGGAEGDEPTALRRDAELQAVAALAAAHDEATALWQQGRYSEAANHFGQLIAVIDALPPPGCGTVEDRRVMQVQRDHLATSASHNLGLVQHSLGANDEALGHICRALAGFELAYGTKAPTTLKALHNVAMVTASAGHLQKAEELYSLAFEARCEVLGPDAHDTLKTACNRGLVLHQAGQHEAAEVALADAQQRASRILGRSHPVGLAIAHNRGLNLSMLGPSRRQEAVSVVRQVMETRRDALGDSHPDTLNAAADLGFLLASDETCGEGDGTTEARSLLVTALKQEEATLGASHPQTLRTRRLLAELEAKAEAARADVGAAGVEASVRLQEDAALLAGLEAGEGEAVALLLHIYIAPAHRRRGAAREALAAALRAAWAAHASRVVAVVAQANEAAIGLLWGGGFEEAEHLHIGGELHCRFELRSPCAPAAVAQES